MNLLYHCLAALPLGIILLSGCKKEDVASRCQTGCTTVQGRFMTGNGTEPLRGLPIKVVWFRDYGFFGRTGLRTKATTTTDADGNYTLRYALTEEELTTGYLDADIEIVNQPAYYGIQGAHVPTVQQRDTLLVAPTYWLPRPASLVCKLLNPADMQTNDRISLDITFKPGPGRNGYGGTVAGFASPAITGSSTTTSFDVPAEQLLRIKVLRYRNSDTPLTVTRDSLLLGRNEERTYEVRF
ncbi:hypothetical protein LRS06_11490 [Hymenobacter sp. J193]|uniref:hypothetical protein n=1 Tax=Hymenobacter sp. J193 TaxID=2898429 RepID=UPI002150CCE7|nr:hypothetical protein [Hymenobacter sp. J193]MCR5888376.1 hypothetical protein [Hymenobacter sp. J193]